MGPDLKWLIRINLIRIAGCLPDAFSTGMAGAFLFPMIAGGLMNTLGNRLPVIKTSFGGAHGLIADGEDALWPDPLPAGRRIQHSGSRREQRGSPFNTGAGSPFILPTSI